MVTQAPTYFELLNMSRTIYGLTPLQIAGGGAFAGTAVANDMDLGTTVVGGTALICGAPLALKAGKKVVWDAPKWAYQNYGNYKQGFGTLLTDYKTGINNNRALAQNLKGDNYFQSVSNRMQYNNLAQLEAKLPTDLKTGFDKSHYYKLKAENPTEAAKYLEKFKEQKTIKKLKVDCYKSAKAKIADIKAKVGRGELKGKALKEAITDLNKSISEGDVAVQKLIQEGKIKPTSRLGKIGANLKKFTGINAISKAMNNTIAKGAVEGAGKGAKVAAGSCKALKGFVKGGGAITAAIELAFEAPEIYETFKTLGTAKGLKQLGKSATVAVASGVGYWAGAAVGGKVGASVGAAIGTVVPGIGNAIGAVVGGVIGVACGLVGSWLCGKAAKAVVGPSELEKARKTESQKLAQEAYNDPQKRKEVVEAFDALINGREELLAEGIDETKIPQEQLDVAA